MEYNLNPGCPLTMELLVNENAPCTYCNGAGSVPINFVGGMRCSTRMVKCDYCNGTGKLKDLLFNFFVDDKKIRYPSTAFESPEPGD